MPVEWMNPNKSGCMRKSWKNFSTICRSDILHKDDFRQCDGMWAARCSHESYCCCYLLSDRLRRCRRWFIINHTFSIFGYWMSTWPNDGMNGLNEWMNEWVIELIESSSRQPNGEDGKAVTAAKWKYQMSACDNSTRTWIQYSFSLLFSWCGFFAFDACVESAFQNMSTYFFSMHYTLCDIERQRNP